MIKIENGNVEVSQESREEVLWDFESMCYVIGNILKIQELGIFKDKKINDLMHSIILDCKIFNNLIREAVKPTKKIKIKHNGEKFGQIIQFPQKDKDKNDKN